MNADSYRQLTAAGIAVHWAPSGQIFHQKTLVIDDAAAWIGTGNLTARYYPTSRDAWISDTNPTQVTAIAGTFNTDWASPSHSGNAVGAPGLVWSPGAQQQIVADIAAAHTRVDFTSEELAESQVIAALAAAARRGVLCRIVMTDSRSWTRGFTQVTTAGCTVHVFPDTADGLYIHEKQIIVDGVGADHPIGATRAAARLAARDRDASFTPQVVAKRQRRPAVPPWAVRTSAWRCAVSAATRRCNPKSRNLSQNQIIRQVVRPVEQGGDLVT